MFFLVYVQAVSIDDDLIPSKCSTAECSVYFHIRAN